MMSELDRLSPCLFQQDFAYDLTIKTQQEINVVRTCLNVVGFGGNFFFCVCVCCCYAKS